MTVKKNLWTKTTCAYCGVGCGVEAQVNAQGLLDIRGDSEHPANYGRLCSKGLALGETVSHEGRLLHPSIDGIETDWQHALDHVAAQFADIISEHGPNSVAFYASGQLLTEDYYVANKLMKGFIGSGNIDTNSRLCMSSTVAGHKRAFGSDTVPACYEDIEKTDMLVISGSNLAWCHPVLFQRLKAVKEQRPELFIVVIDPRKTATCAIADLHLAIQPGSDVALFNGLLAYLSEHNKTDNNYIKKYCQGFSSALASAENDCVNSEQLVKKLAICEEDLNLFYHKFANTEKVVTIYSQGVNQSSQGTDKVNSILNCHLATGRIGKQGMGPFSVTGQPNAMGGREVGGLANTLAAHMEFGNKQDHHLISDFWQTNNLASSPGLKAIDMFDAIEQGEIKGIWIMATNPVVSLPNSNKTIAALKKCPLVVVSDCIKETATTQLANVLLPAQGWSEKSGTVTNSERRISRQRRILASPGEAKADWWIICEVAKRMGFSNAFNYLHEGEIFAEYAKMTTLGNKDGLTRDLNLIGLTQLDKQGYSQLTPQQWPVRELQRSIVQQRMFADNLFFTANKKAQFIAVSHKKPLSPCNQNYPFELNSGRIRDHWHTMTRTGLSSRLSAHISEPFISIHPFDAQQKQLSNDDLVTVNSQRGSLLVRVSITTTLNKGQVFMPIHWNQKTANKANICSLIDANSDQISGQPEFKSTPVNLSKWHYNSEAIFLSRVPLDLTKFAYWVKQKVEGGYLYHLADNLSVLDLKVELEALLENKNGKNIHYSNSSNNLPHDKPLYRYANIQKQKVVCAFIVANDLKNQSLDWLQALLSVPLDASIERSLISGLLEGILAQGKIICACKQVGKTTIQAAIKDQKLASINAISRCTSAGTGCGSCLPDIEEMLSEHVGNYIAV